MKIFYLSLLFLALTCVENPGLAQAGLSGNTISGVIIDSASTKPLSLISVSVKTKNLPLQVTLTNTDGSFTLKGLKPEKYTLSVFSVDHHTKTVEADLSETLSSDRNLGTIYISPRVNTLKELVINGSRSLIKQEIDRITYDLEADPDSKGNNVMTMMRKIPLLSVDAEDNVLFKGKEDFKVLINGRPSSMMERNLKEVLRNMPASSIQRIEVITSPSAKYDAEGLAGMINIVTSRKMEGYKGTLNVNERYPVGGPGFGSSLTLKRGKLGLSVLGGASDNQSPQIKSSNDRLGTDMNRTNLHQSLFKKFNGYSGYLGSELSYELSKFSLLSTQMNLNGSVMNSELNQNSVLNDNAGVLQGYEAYNTSTTEGKGWDAAINYQLGFKANKSRLLTLSYQYLSHQTDLQSHQNILNRVDYIVPDFKQRNNGSASEQTFQIDYVHPLKHVILEAGLKGVFRLNKSDFIYGSFNSTNGIYEIDHNKSNLFRNEQRIFSAYNSYQFQFRKFNFKTGFRLEQTVIDADFVSDQSSVFKNYLNFIPTVAISRKMNASSTLGFGFSQRIKRPGINRLNPFIDRTNPNFESSGNPNLEPALINSVQVTVSRIKKSTLNLSMDYSFVKNLFMQNSSFNPITQTTRTTFENTGKASGLSANLYVSCPLTKALSFGINGNGGLNRLEGVDGNAVITVQLFTYNLSAFSNYHFGKGWRSNMNLSFISRNITSLQGTSNALISSSVGINRELIKNKLSFSVSAKNPFTKYRLNKIESLGSNFSQTSSSQEYFRSFNASINYSFGKLKADIKKNKRGIKNDDLAN
jgi:ferric enterobactin receptor